MSGISNDYINKYEPLWGGWHIQELLGEGSFGKVYKITKEEWGYHYVSALKLICIPTKDQYREALATLENNEEMLEQYFEDAIKSIVNEIRLLYSLRGNSNVVSYEDHIVEKNKDAFGWDILIRMEYVTSLSKHISQNPMTREQVISLGIDICTALETCAKKGIIHRDIKDENIFVSDDGLFKLGDFGIARELSKSGRAASMKGTPLYSAPEVFKGETYDVTADLYSLGIVLYKLLNYGRLPFMPPYPEMIRYRDSETALDKRISGEPLPPPPLAGERLVQVILKACSYDPTDRYISAFKMKRMLESVLSDMTDAEKSEVVTLSKTPKAPETSEIPLPTAPQALETATIDIQPLQTGGEGGISNVATETIQQIDITELQSSTEVPVAQNTPAEEKTVQNIPPLSQPPLEEPACLETGQHDDPLESQLAATADLETFEAINDEENKTDPSGTVCLFNESRPQEPQETDPMPDAKEEPLEKNPSMNLDGTVCLFEGDPGQHKLQQTKDSPLDTAPPEPDALNGTVCLFENADRAPIHPQGSPSTQDPTDQDIDPLDGNALSNGTVCLFQSEPSTGKGRVQDPPPLEPTDVPHHIQGVALSPTADPQPPFEKSTSSVDTPTPAEGLFSRVFNKVTGKASNTGSEELRKLFGSGNISNGSLVSCEGNKIYFCNLGGNSYLYQMDSNGNDKKIVNTDPSWFINIHDGWLYYSNESDNDTLYKIRVDGKSNTKLNDDSSWNLNILDGWIYYSNDSDDYTLYKIKLDGSKRTKVVNDVAHSITVFDQWIYFCNKSVGGKIYKVSPDGETRIRLNHDDSDFINIAGDWIFYCNKSDGNSLYKIKLDGSQRAKLSEDFISNLNAFEDFIFYSNTSDGGKIYRICPNGSGRLKLNEDKSDYINIVFPWIYYCNKDDGGSLYKLRFDGSDRTKISETPPLSSPLPTGPDPKDDGVDGDWLYL